ncbi:hypothetical protein PUN28_005809 [Cardiocondyla obscurior]
MEPVSAFAAYSKCKNAKELNERKRKRNSQKISNQKRKKQKAGKQTEGANLQIQPKEKIKSIKKLNNANNKIKLKGKINDSRNIHKKLKLKIMKKQNKKVKKTKKKSTQITGTILKERVEDSENNSNDINCVSHLNNISNETNEEYHSNGNPIQDSQALFRWILDPIDIETFLSNYWEKTPVYVKRDVHNYYKHIVSTPLLDKMLRTNHILFTKNIDITSYSNGVRETHNPPGRALPSIVWDYYQNKCSVRMLNPQTYIPMIHSLNATLQEFFGCFVGANLYLTPPNSQGFAPHYDDVEAFILQIEGQKRWRLYRPLNKNEYLPRYSSKNFDQSEIGKPILDTIVKAGDLLYLPRGTIHQGMTVDNTHSLHVTLSVYQKNSWTDLLEKVLPQALKEAAENDCRFREGLPLDYLTYVGAAYDASSHKDIFKNRVKNLITLLLEHIDIDNAADLMAKNHIHDFLPPFLFKNERKCTVAEDGEIMTNNGRVQNHAEITPETRIRLLRLHCIR